VCAITTGTYDISTDLDPATKLILEEIIKLGVKLVNSKGAELIITPKEFEIFWKQGSNSPHPQCLASTMATTRQPQCKITTKVLAQQ
jgi:hypothetical protein